MPWKETDALFFLLYSHSECTTLGTYQPLALWFPRTRFIYAWRSASLQESTLYIRLRSDEHCGSYRNFILASADMCSTYLLSEKTSCPLQALGLAPAIYRNGEEALDEVFKDGTIYRILKICIRKISFSINAGSIWFLCLHWYLDLNGCGSEGRPFSLPPPNFLVASGL